MKRSKFKETYISSREELKEFCKDIRGTGRIVFDTEFVSENTYYPQLALVQLTAGNRLALIDPLEIEDLSPLLNLLYDEKIEKVVHSGRIDLAIFCHIEGRVPCPVFDTQIAASLTGLGASISYNNLVKELCKVKLDKTATYTNWLRRPLSREQIEYAKDDVRYLGEIADILKEKLDDLGRTQWAEEEFEKLTALVEEETSEENLMNSRSVKGANHMTPEERKIVQQLYCWREKRARRKNLPRGWVMRDDLLVEIAARRPETLEEIAEIRGINKKEIEKTGRQILDAVKKGLASDEPEMNHKSAHPRAKSSETPLISLLMALLNLKASKAKVAPGVLATREDIQSLVEAFPNLDDVDLPILNGWRRELVGNDLLEVLSGRAKLGVNSHKRLKLYK